MLAIEHSRDQRIATLTLNRPDKRNALNRSLVTELTSVIDSLSVDPLVRVIILTGAGSVFSAGADLKALAEMRDASREENLEDSAGLASLFLSMRNCSKVIVGRINGHAIAGGAGLVAACDVSFASDKALFGFTETKIGFVPAIVSVLLRSRLNETVLRDLLLSARLVAADEAARMGLVTFVVKEVNLNHESDAYAQALARETSPEAIASTKKLLTETAELTLKDALDSAVRTNAIAREGADCKVGVNAFLQKQDSPWVRAYDDDHRDPA